MLCILKALLTWAVLVLLGTNLVGLVVRGFVWSAPEIDMPSARVRDLVAGESRRMSAANFTMTLFGILATGAYLFALDRFFGFGLLTAGVIVMASRMPDLLWEVRTGGRVTRQNAPQGILHVVATLLLWSALPLTWYSLYR